jgi:hypothetical protein
MVSSRTINRLAVAPPRLAIVPTPGARREPSRARGRCSISRAVREPAGATAASAAGRTHANNRRFEPKGEGYD